MYISLIAPIVLLASLVASAPAAQADKPSGHEVAITGIAYAGSGCPAGSVAGQISGDLTYITLLYANFIAQSGKGLSASQNRKNCQLNVKLRFPQGWQFSVFKADYRGYAQVPRGITGVCKATYYFSGESRQISSTLNIPGPYDSNYLKTDQFGVESTVWSPCGAEGLLNINSEVRVSGQTSLDSQMTVDSTDLKFTQLHYLQWRKC